MSLENAVHKVLELPSYDLIKRKLSHLKQQQVSQWLGNRQRFHQQMQEQVITSFNAGKFSDAFRAPSLYYYDELSKSARDITQSWPGILWQNMRPILDHVSLEQGHMGDVQALLDSFSWSIRGPEPFTLGYIDQEKFLTSISDLARSYNCPSLQDDKRFMKVLQLKSALTETGIKNWARTSRVGVGLEVEEYFLERSTQAHTFEASGSFQGSTSYSDRTLFPNPPKKLDDWYLVIEDVVRTFNNQYQRLPNEVETWKVLRTNPPHSYGITSGEDRGEDAVYMDDKALGREGFTKRWKRYSKAPPKSDQLRTNRTK